MIAYASRRIALAIPTLIIVCVGVFALIRLIPGDPAQAMLGETATGEQVAAMRHTLGLDLPMPVQFTRWLGDALRGDLGQSIVNKLPVLPLVLDRAAISGLIVLLAISIAAAIALPLGLIAAWRQNSLLDFGVVAGAAVLMSIPSFWLGLMLLLLFGLRLGWLPVVGFVPFSQSFGGAML